MHTSRAAPRSHPREAAAHLYGQVGQRRRERGAVAAQRPLADEYRSAVEQYDELLLLIVHAVLRADARRLAEAPTARLAQKVGEAVVAGGHIRVVGAEEVPPNAE